MHPHTFMKPSVEHLRRLSFLGLFALASALAGCGIGSVTTETGGALAATGSVHGGVQPITGATIELYAVGTAGNGSQATSLLRSPVVTDSHSYFTLTGDYTCPSANTQVYLVARGGNPGYSTAVNNRALVLLSPLGSCSNLAANPNRFISVNEVSTVAAVYALAPFMTAYDHVGGSATNATGVANAFLNAQLLVDPATGLAPQLASNLAIESGKLYALADAIVPCVNSDGGTACNPLFTAASVNGTAPTDVLGALLNIVKHPGNNVSGVFNAIGSTPPYPTTLTTVPHDWTMSLSVTGGGLNQPTTIGIDKFGNVWAANYGEPVNTAGLVGFSPQGTPLPGSPFSPGLQSHSYGLAVDKNNDIWVSSQDNVQVNGSYGSIAKFRGAASSTPGALVGQFTDGSISQSEAIAADPTGSGSIFVGNYHNGLASVFDLNGNFLKSLGDSSDSGPNGINAIIPDGAGGAWVGDQGDGYIFHLFADRTIQPVNCCQAVQTLAFDLHGNIWATNYSAVGLPPKYTFSEVAPNGNILIQQQPGTGLFSPGGAAIDAGGQFWIANHYSANGRNAGEFAEIAGNDTSVPAGTTLSPAGGLGLDAGMSLAYAVALDASGNVWISNNDVSSSSIKMFFGLATPTATPLGLNPQAP